MVVFPKELNRKISLLIVIERKLLHFDAMCSEELMAHF